MANDRLKVTFCFWQQILHVLLCKTIYYYNMDIDKYYYNVSRDASAIFIAYVCDMKLRATRKPSLSMGVDDFRFYIQLNLSDPLWHLTKSGCFPLVSSWIWEPHLKCEHFNTFQVHYVYDLKLMYILGYLKYTRYSLFCSNISFWPNLVQPMFWPNIPPPPESHPTFIIIKVN